MLNTRSRQAAVFLLQAAAIGLFSLVLLGIALRFRGGELAALAAGPALIVPTIYAIRVRLRR